jgi:peptidyl-prolyl cis-trans isomerase SurA
MDEVGSISEPKPFSLITGGKAYRIVRLDQRIPEHVANMKKDYERLKSIALQRKQLQEFTRWINELKSEVYIEYRIPMPSSENE